MDDKEFKHLQELNEKLKNELSEKSKDVSESWDQPYKCYDCGQRVNYAFIMPFIKASGMCPDCFNKDEE